MYGLAETSRVEGPDVLMKLRIACGKIDKNHKIEGTEEVQACTVCLVDVLAGLNIVDCWHSANALQLVLVLVSFAVVLVPRLSPTSRDGSRLSMLRGGVHWYSLAIALYMYQCDL